MSEESKAFETTHDPLVHLVSTAWPFVTICDIGLTRQAIRATEREIDCMACIAQDARSS